jgi:nicotinamidase/pyrazinamidase
MEIRGDDVLVVVDVQNDFCPGGALAVPEGDAVIAPILQAAPRFGHIVLTQDWHPAGHGSFATAHEGRKPLETVEMPYGEQVLWPEHCVQGTWGAELHPALDLPQAELILRKGFRPDVDSYSAFFENDQRTETGLAGYLRERGLKRAFFAGLAYDFCVGFSALDARRLGLEAVVLPEASRAIDVAGSAEAMRKRLCEAGAVEAAL